jgi:hypothetical protein
MHMSSIKSLLKQYVFNKQTLAKTENAIKNEQPRDTSSIGHKTQNEDNNNIK